MVRVLCDAISGRPVATAKLERFLEEATPHWRHPRVCPRQRRARQPWPGEPLPRPARGPGGAEMGAVVLGWGPGGQARGVWHRGGKGALGLATAGAGRPNPGNLRLKRARRGGLRLGRQLNPETRGGRYGCSLCAAAELTGSGGSSLRVCPPRNVLGRVGTAG